MLSLKIRFGKAVRRLRSQAGFSQERFASEIGMNRGYYGSIERGEVNISLDNIEKIAKKIGLSVGQLMIEVDGEK